MFPPIISSDSSATLFECLNNLNFSDEMMKCVVLISSSMLLCRIFWQLTVFPRPHILVSFPRRAICLSYTSVSVLSYCMCWMYLNWNTHNTTNVVCVCGINAKQTSEECNAKQREGEAECEAKQSKYTPYGCMSGWFYIVDVFPHIWIDIEHYCVDYVGVCSCFMLSKYVVYLSLDTFFSYP